MKRRMNAYKASFVGSIQYLSRNAPCHTCGDGLTCTVGSMYNVYGEEGLGRLRRGKDLYGDWELDAETANKVRLLGDSIKAGLGKA